MSDPQPEIIGWRVFNNRTQQWASRTYRLNERRPDAKTRARNRAWQLDEEFGAAVHSVLAVRKEDKS